MLLAPHDGHPQHASAPEDLEARETQGLPSFGTKLASHGSNRVHGQNSALPFALDWKPRAGAIGTFALVGANMRWGLWPAHAVGPWKVF